MAEVHVFGRVTNDLQLKMSHRQVPYVAFGLVEWIGRRDTGHRQYFEVWAWGTAALSLADARTKAKPRRCPAAAASCGGRGRRSGTPAGISVFRQSEKEEPRDVF